MAPDTRSVREQSLCLMQIAGEVGSLAESRELLARSMEPVIYEPRDMRLWNEAFDQYCRVV